MKILTIYNILQLGKYTFFPWEMLHLETATCKKIVSSILWTHSFEGVVAEWKVTEFGSWVAVSSIQDLCQACLVILIR